MAGCAPADMLALFDGDKPTNGGSGGSDGRFEKILIDMERRFPPEVWEMIDWMLRDLKHRDGAHLLARALAERMATLPVWGMTFCTTRADDTADVSARTDALVCLERLAGSDRRPLRSPYRVVKDTGMLGGLSHGIVADDLVLNGMPRYGPLLLGLCAGMQDRSRRGCVRCAQTESGMAASRYWTLCVLLPDMSTFRPTVWPVPNYCLRHWRVATQDGGRCTA